MKVIVERHLGQMMCTENHAHQCVPATPRLNAGPTALAISDSVCVNPGLPGLCGKSGVLKLRSAERFPQHVTALRTSPLSPDVQVNRGILSHTRMWPTRQRMCHEHFWQAD